VYEVSHKLELLKPHHRMRYRLNWEIYDKESGDTFRRERFYEKPKDAYAGFDWAEEGRTMRVRGNLPAQHA
jgi:hypothetical protein